MKIQPRFTANRRLPLRSRPLLALCLTLIMVFAGCAAIQLNSFNKHAANGNHAWIAAQTITCDKASNVCGRLHLIKGDACFHLAKVDPASVANYACAADELELGLSLNRSWANPTLQRQFQENLCESLENLQDLQSNEAAAQTLARFEDAAKGLYQLAPRSASAVYYLSAARLKQVQSMLMDINPADRIPVCNRLKRALTNVLSMMEATKKEPLPESDRFADRYQRLSYDLGVAIRDAECR
jgi:hypothetical protein